MLFVKEKIKFSFILYKNICFFLKPSSLLLIYFFQQELKRSPRLSIHNSVNFPIFPRNGPPSFHVSALIYLNLLSRFNVTKRYSVTLSDLITYVYRKFNLI